MQVPIDALATTIVAIVLFGALCAALALVTLALRRPGSPTPGSLPLQIAAGLVALALVVVAVVPVSIPILFAAVLAVLAIALAVIGGNPFTRWMLAVADGGRTAEGARGGILIELAAEQTAPQQEEILRGGMTIGFLERAAVSLGILAGFPAVVAVVVALKGIGRFTELATPAARERFIVGTMASLLWACAVGGLGYTTIM